MPGNGDFRLPGGEPAGVQARPSPKPGLEHGAKFDDDKVRMDLLPPRPLFEIAEVLTYGARKYEAHNWSKGIKFHRLFRALLGHVWAWWSGEDNDPETGYSHLAHAGCCLIFMMDLRHTKPEFDDRPVGVVAKLPEDRP